MAPQQLITLAALLFAAVILPQAEARRFMLADNGTSSEVESGEPGVSGEPGPPGPEPSATPEPEPAAAVATSSSGVSSALNGTLEAPSFWWGTPANIANSTYKEQTKVFKNETYFKVLALELPYTIVLKYTEASGPLSLGRSKGGRELGQVAPRGAVVPLHPAVQNIAVVLRDDGCNDKREEGSVYAYTFPPQRGQRVVYISDQDNWDKTNTFLPVKLL